MVCYSSLRFVNLELLTFSLPNSGFPKNKERTRNDSQKPEQARQVFLQ